MGRETDRQTDRQRNVQTVRGRDRQIDRAYLCVVADFLQDVVAAIIGKVLDLYEPGVDDPCPRLEAVPDVLTQR